MPPGDFWSLCPFEVSWWIEAAEDNRIYGNGMSGRQVRETYEAAYGPKNDDV